MESVSLGSTNVQEEVLPKEHKKKQIHTILGSVNEDIEVLLNNVHYQSLLNVQVKSLLMLLFPRNRRRDLMVIKQ